MSCYSHIFPKKTNVILTSLMYEYDPFIIYRQKKINELKKEKVSQLGL